MSYLEAEVDAVYTSGRAVSAQKGNAEQIAGLYLRQLAEAEGVVKHPVVVGGVTEFAQAETPKVNQMAPQIDALGQDTSSVAVTVDEADAESTGVLTVPGQQAGDQNHGLHRPINAF